MTYDDYISNAVFNYFEPSDSAAKCQICREAIDELEDTTSAWDVICKAGQDEGDYQAICERNEILPDDYELPVCSDCLVLVREAFDDGLSNNDKFGADQTTKWGA